MAVNLNLELIHPECSVGSWNFSKKWQVMSLMPVFVFASLALAVAVAGALCAHNHYVGARILRANPKFLVLGEGRKAGIAYKLKRALVKLRLACHRVSCLEQKEKQDIRSGKEAFQA